MIFFCRTYLTDSINISKDEDMARIQSMALLLLAKLLKDPDILRAAYEWTTKSSDQSLLVWANTQILSKFFELFRAEILGLTPLPQAFAKSKNLDMHQQMGQAEQANQIKQTLEPTTQALEGERQLALQSPGHQLIKVKKFFKKAKISIFLVDRRRR